MRITAAIFYVLVILLVGDVMPVSSVWANPGVPSVSSSAQSSKAVGNLTIVNSDGRVVLSCNKLLPGDPSGFYNVTINGVAQTVYCENTIRLGSRTGGWTLVWSHFRGTKNNITTDMPWSKAIGATSILRSTDNNEYIQTDLQLFEAYIGLRWWPAIIGQGPNVSSGEIYYQWSADFSSNRRIDREAGCGFSLNEQDSWRFTVRNNCNVPASGRPGLFSPVSNSPTGASGAKFTAVDVDNDSKTDSQNSEHCAVIFSGNPWWYGNCWNGSIMGQGERNDFKTNSYNGAYWSGTDPQWGDPNTGLGAGNGWIFIR